MNILFILLLCVFIIFLAVWLFSTSKTLSNFQKSDTPLVIDVKKLSKPTSLNYGYTFWIYINSWENTSLPKAIFYRKSTSTTYAPMVYLGAGTNSLTVEIDTEGTTSANFECTVSNIPLQTWTNITISLNSKVLDIYMNGKLIKTGISSEIPNAPDSTEGITLCPAATTSYDVWDGKIARFQYYSDPISAQEAWNIYKKGPSGNLLSSFLNEYKLRLSFLKGGDEKANITI